MELLQTNYAKLDRMFAARLLLDIDFKYSMKFTSYGRWKRDISMVT